MLCYAGGPGVCESLVRALGPDARSLRPYLQRHMAVPGVAMRRDLFECLLAELPRWPAEQLGADIGRIALLAERATPADGPAQAQMLRLLWSAPAQGLPEDVVRRARAAGRALLGSTSMPDTVVRRYEALFEDGRTSAEARDVARLLAEHAFDCRHAPPGDSELDRLPVTSARHALAILSHFARSRSCAGSTLVPLPDEASSGQLVWQAASLFDHGYPKSLGLQESEAADYSRARTLEKERAYNDMLRFVRESMKNASLSSLSLELLLKIGIDVASNCQPPGSTVSLLRSIIIELQHRGGVSPENNRVFSHLLTSFQRQKNCAKVSIRDLINAHDYLVPQLLEDFQKSVLFESPSVRAYLVTELSIYAKMAHQIPTERRVALLGVATALLTISWPPGKVLDLLIDSASLLQFGSISRQMARKMIPALLRIHTRPYYEWLSPKRKSYLYLTLLRLIEQLDKMDDSILVAIETVVASPCEKLNLSEPLSALRNLKKYLRTLPGAAPVELVRSIFEDFPSWTPNDLQTVVGLVRDALTAAARSREPEVVGSVAAVAMRLLRLYNYTDSTEKRLVGVIDRVPVRDDIIPQPLKLVLVNDILFVLATKVTQKSESHVNVQTLLRLLDTVLRGGALPTGTASVESHFIKAVAAFVDNKFALRKVTRELRVRIAELLRRLDLQQYIPLEIVVKIDKQLRKEMWTVIRKVHTTTEERSITQFLQYLRTANRDEIVRMDEGSMRNLPKVMLPLPPRALRNVIAGVEDVLRFNHEIIHRDLARQLLTIVQTAISSPMFPATLLPRSKSVMDALKRDIRHESARGVLYPPAM
ncbi:hypothetical protein HPB52_003321 [Rhipicephalus sanguineus]|uniref:Uncharacterized protein n=1 Tax=Rhipicephalus sanguineus TaxID=34632 RepID=A0A9D4QGT8_RHISA|nr:hypothetical protein HPB52_003321 [Rhipicephalus sanguineus]